jgi:hypothetical protein
MPFPARVSSTNKNQPLNNTLFPYLAAALRCRSFRSKAAICDTVYNRDVQ